MGLDRLPPHHIFERSSKPLIAPTPSDGAALLVVFFLAEHARIPLPFEFGIEGMIGVAG
jgi:hypothetical protein